MKKLIVCAMCAVFGIAALAGEYQVYKFQFNAKTTAAKGILANGCCGDSDDYCYREKQTVKIQGILAGCGCKAIQANGACENAVLYIWDATHKIAITNVTETMLPWIVQRIGKKANGIEHVASLKATYGSNDEYGFDVTMAGFGTYKDNTKDSSASYVSAIDGNFAGIANAPWYVKLGKCTACSVEPDTEEQSIAFDTCDNCSDGLTPSMYSDITPFFGTYSFRYDAGKSKACTKNGLSQKNLGLPSYVGLEDIAATNIIISE